MKTELTCIVCPRGCALVVDENHKVTGNFCPRGEKYALQEVTHPLRTLTTTVKCDSTLFRVCPVKTTGPIPKESQLLLMKQIRRLFVHVPVHLGDVIVHNIDDTGVDLVATRDLLE
ncbi:MAG: DUF1667 domain-containing protein [Candidatus Enteromonas sp.]|nr:DUF1667 domain-containing protein [Candidatus Enteromonas sp.]